MKKKVYQVMAFTTIDGGAPGRFAVFTCNTKESAIEYLKMLNEYIENHEVSIDIFKVDSNKFASGYDEGIDLQEKPYIRELELIDTVFPTINEAKNYFKQLDKRYKNGENITIWR